MIPYIGDSLLEDAIPRILSTTGAVLFLDGLDEISELYKRNIETQAVSISRKLTNSKIIISCRSGDYTSHIDNFDVIELCNLKEVQISEIVSKWSKNPDVFLRNYKLLPYFDLSNSPLLLTQLIVLHNTRGYFPDQAVDIYGKIIELMLEQWDNTRKIKRGSLYESFSPLKKKTFLSSLSYQLTYKQKSNRFNDRDLIEAYSRIYRKFHLKGEEASLVVKEIESHTGLIVRSGYEHYEFSHLSLQEYLCALYMVSVPPSSSVSLYLHEYPAPLAIAATLSPETSSWFAHIVLSPYTETESSFNNLLILLDRLRSEGAIIDKGPLVGRAFIKLIGSSHRSANEKFRIAVEDMVSRPDIIESIKSEIVFYKSQNYTGKNKFVTIERRCRLLDEYDNQGVPSFELPAAAFSYIVKLCNLSFCHNKNEEHITYISP